MKWARRGAVAAGVLLLLWLAAWLGVPPLLKWQLQSRSSALLGRSLSVGEVQFAPWRLELTLQRLALGPAAAAPAAPPAEPPLQVARVRLNLAFWPLFKGEPVVESLDIDAPRLRVARLAEGRYDIDDLLERLAGPGTPSSAEPTHFALYNVQLRDGQLLFDDRPVQRIHRVEALHLALPFLSNRPAQVQVTVAPHLAFRLNGAAFDSGAQATPFAPTQHAVLKLAVSDLDLGPYRAYLPQTLPLRVARGSVSADLALEFTRPAGAAPQVLLRGWVAARDVGLTHPDGRPLLAWQQLRLGLRELQPLARRLAFDTLRVDGARLPLARDAAGRLVLPALATSAEGPAATAASASAPASSPRAAPAGPAPWQISLDGLQLADAQVAWHDASVTPAADLQLDALRLDARALQWPAPRPVPLSLAATLRSGGRSGTAPGAAPDAAPGAVAGQLALEGTLSDHDAALKLQLSELALPALAPYLAQAVLPRVEGRLAAQAQLAWSSDAQAPRLQLVIDQATLDGLRVQPGRRRGEPDGAALKQLALAELQIDLAARTAVLGSVRLHQPSLQLVRDAQGGFNVLQWLRPAPPSPAAAGAHGGPAAPPWRVQLRQLQLDGGRLQLADGFVRRERPLRLEVQQLRLGVQDLAWHGDQAMPPAKVQLDARVARPATAREPSPVAGTIAWRGEAGHRPLQAGGTLRLVRLPLQAMAAYFEGQLPLRLVRAEAGYSGRFSLREQPGGWAVRAAGDVLLGDVHTTTLPDPDNPAALATGADELLSWQSLALERLSFTMTPGARPQLEVGAAALTDFYARLEVTEQGHFNLQDVRASAPAGAASAAAASTSPAASAPAPAPAASAPAPAAAAGLPLDIRIGGTTLNNGRIDFSDHFVRPNYSAALTELNGTLGPLSSGSRDMAALQLRGRAAGTALLDIRGQLNPTVQPPALDIQARATDLELAPLSTYAAKYAGYAIERGKLSLDVAYKIEPDGRLQARNQLVLNQLTFGERVESPSATKLPVLLAVALLKDRHGVIDINLPST
ncbi:DUF748 domain-containing protein [Aquabacterium sp.]|uniref:DUF748 domain-containing protein n=1 Tax=Aquabacterium sp. TaxID=1872578 RepID=UPI003784FFD6